MLAQCQSKNARRGASPRCPASLGEAIALAEGSELLRRTLGDFVFDSLLRNKKMEWGQYRSTVTDYEIARYLPLL